MRPGNRWNGEAANPITAAIYGAVVSLAVGYSLSYLFQLFRLGVVTAHYSPLSREAFLLAGLNLYAAQHITLVGSGILADAGRIHATIDFPLTLWAAIPALSLILGGLLAARTQAPAGRWRMVITALGSVIIYVVVLVVMADIVNVIFTSAALPAIRGIEFNPPAIPFKPSILATLKYGSLFAVIFTYLGALISVRHIPGLAIKGKWWACAKAVVIVAIAMQLLFVACGIWLAARSTSHDADDYIQSEVAQSLPAAVGIVYALIHGARLSYAAVPASMPSESYSSSISLYKGVTTSNGGKLTHRSLGRVAWIAALIGAIAAFAAGRLAVKMGSRDGSLPTSLRILILQSAFMAVTMLLCGMGWGVAGQFRFIVKPRFDNVMLYIGAVIVIFSLLGAHWANRRYSGRLSGFPSV